MNPQQKGATIEALIRYEGQVDRARRYLGLSKREMKARTKEVLDELPISIASPLRKEYGFMEPKRKISVSTRETENRISALVLHRWNVKEAAEDIGVSSSTLYYFIKRPTTRKYAADNGIEIPARFRAGYKTIIPLVEVPVVEIKPEEIASVLIKALEATTAIHNQAKDGLLAMQETLTAATDKAISEVFHIVRQANGQVICSPEGSPSVPSSSLTVKGLT